MLLHLNMYLKPAEKVGSVTRFRKLCLCERQVYHAISKTVSIYSFTQLFQMPCIVLVIEIVAESAEIPGRRPYFEKYKQHNRHYVTTRACTWDLNFV